MKTYNLQHNTDYTQHRHGIQYTFTYNDSDSQHFHNFSTLYTYIDNLYTLYNNHINIVKHHTPTISFVHYDNVISIQITFM